MKPGPTTPEAVLQINRDLAAVLCADPAQIALGAHTSLEDEIVLCGLLGGKNVGKSTLINALARVPVSIDVERVGEGTDRPIAFVHEDVTAAVTDRLRDLHHRTEVRTVTHRSDALINVVLVDLPDFDSEFPGHLAIVRDIAPLLDRVLWVLTPRKIGDRAWVEMFQSVIKDTRNVRCVLNKVDELLTDGDAFADGNGDALRSAAGFWQRQKEWVTSSLEASGCRPPGDSSYLIASAFPTRAGLRDRVAASWDDPGWDRYADERTIVDEVARLAAEEFEQLHASVLAPLTVEEVSTIKNANVDRELAVAVERIRTHYELERIMSGLDHACDPAYLREVLNEAMDSSFCGAVGSTLEARLRPDRQLADELLEKRIEPHSLLRVAYWPLGWISRMAGRRISPTDSGSAPAPDDPFVASGPTLDDRVDGMRARLLSDHATLDDQLGLRDEMPSTETLTGSTRRAVKNLGPKLERRLIDAVHADDPRPSRLLGGFLWLVLLWFPFIQPITAGLLEIMAEPEMQSIAHGLYKIVVAFGAGKLLAGFAVVGLVYVGVLAVLYTRALAAIRKAKREQAESAPVLDAVDEALTQHILLPLVAPFQRKLEKLSSIVATLKTIGVSRHE